MKIRTLIIDDEKPARGIIHKMLKEDKEIEVIGECSNAKEAIQAVREFSPDLLFLDIQMPEMDGFSLLEALEALREDKTPAVIFVTAYTQYAVKAFECSAIDYLLKPFDYERMQKALQKAKKNLCETSNEDRNQQILELLRQLHFKSEPLDRFVIKKSGRVLLIPIDEVDWIETEGNYLLIHVGQTSHIIRETMNNLELRLDLRKFFRIHRSTIVNINSVKELQTHFNEEYLVILKDGTKLVLSRRYREKLSKRLGTII